MDGMIFCFSLHVHLDNVFRYMKKKIAILGSTGSIGKNTINILKKDKKNIKIVPFNFK